MTTYNRTHWVNDSDPPISAENLNNIEQGIVDAHEHMADENNPHNTTPEKIGAAKHGDFLAHVENVGNPHDTKHDQTDPPGATADENTVKDKHISNKDYKLIGEHLADQSGNPHDVKHDQTNPLGANLSGTDSVRNKHVSDADATRWEAHVNHANPHPGHETPEGAQAKVDLHADNEDNPHKTTAGQVGAPTKEEFEEHRDNEAVHVSPHQRASLDNTLYVATAENPVVTYVELQEMLAGGVKASVENLADLAAIPPEERSDDDMRLVTEAGIIYRFDIHATDGDVEPVDGPGYWLAIESATPSHNNLVGLQGGSPGASEYYHLTQEERDATVEHYGTQGNPHDTTAEQVGALVSINGVSNPGGNVEIVYEGQDVQLTLDAEEFKIILENLHNPRTDNPHNVKHEQTEPLGAEADTNETKNKHVSNNDFRLWEEHRTSMDAHGATPLLVPERAMSRDGEGRAQVADPEEPLDIATKGYVDSKANAVQDNLAYHHGMTNAHGATSAPEAEKLIIRDGAGRAQVEDPQGEKDIVNKRSMDAALEGFFKMDGGTNTFVGNGGERSFTHNLGGVPRTVQVTPIAPNSSGTGGTVGEVWYRANETTIWVGNTGSATISFGWFAML